MTENNIKNLRLQKHFSQEQLAEKARVSVRTIQRLEAGEDASIETLNLIAGAPAWKSATFFLKKIKRTTRYKKRRTSCNTNCNDGAKNTASWPWSMMSFS